MPAERTVTLYVGNRLDEAREITPAALAGEFIQAVRDGYFKDPCGGGGEWAMRLWLTGRDGANATWDVGDEDEIFGALRADLNGSDETRAMLIAAVWGES